MRYLPLLLLPLFLISACKSSPPDPDNDVLPPISMEGANTFGCLFNGEVWLPGTDLFAFPTKSVRYLGGSLNYISVNMNRRFDDLNIDDAISFTIFLTDDDQEFEYVSFRGLSNIHGCYEYLEDENFPFEFNILKLDYTERILSATFEFDLISTCDSLDRIEIRDGRIDFSIL